MLDLVDRDEKGLYDDELQRGEADEAVEGSRLDSACDHGSSAPFFPSW